MLYLFLRRTLLELIRVCTMHPRVEEQSHSVTIHPLVFPVGVIDLALHKLALVKLFEIGVAPDF